MKGWFKVPGIRPDGDRTATEQLMGLAPALAETRAAAARGEPYTVLDLGCAEGVIGLEFARAGAKSVFGIELLETHLQVARKLVEQAVAANEFGRGVMSFQCAHLNDIIEQEKATIAEWRYDVVLALGIIHKLPDPNVPMAFAADACERLLCFRAPAKKEPGNGGDYLIKSKFTEARCNVPALMRAKGFVDEGTINGVRGEAVQYWRRKS